ncbi:hypothetical protein [uncultured Pedobacter sp.]|uniref:hypothetical protein n=1 Tax=uncultured Pedobacter sp. TaxID=246139 RepID=UPI0025EDCD6C|nr:hypothetical protein [uncultured Pedobacter sp.]
MRDFIKVGLIQPTINPDEDWGNGTPDYLLNINPVAASRVWDEIALGLAEMIRTSDRPDIILIPELHLPPSKVNYIKLFSKKYNITIIAGIDFSRNPTNLTKVRNRGIICFSTKGFGGGKKSYLHVRSMAFGKSFFTYMEHQMFKTGLDAKGPHSADPEGYMYVFESNELGNFGIMICSDIFDIERLILYQGRIHHLFIISLNKDLNTYFAMAESLTRLLYCNVVICNTGFYGGSTAISPYSDPNSRTIYKYIGQKMFNTHVIDIPLKSLDESQRFEFDKKPKGDNPFKAWPPGFVQKKSKGIKIDFKKR